MKRQKDQEMLKIYRIFSIFKKPLKAIHANICRFNVIVFLLILQHAYGQNLIKQHYSIANGLPSNEVFSAYQDKIGYVWLTTDRGLCRFDGQTFKIYTVNEGLSENTSLEVKEDKNGKIWCRSYSGLFSIIDKDKIYSPKINNEIIRLNLGRQLYQFEIDDSLNIYLATRMDGNIYKSSYPYDKLSPLKITNGDVTFFQISSSKHLTSYNWSLTASEHNLKTVICRKNTATVITSMPKKGLEEKFFLRYVYNSESLFISSNEFLHIFSLKTNEMITKTLPFRVSSMSLQSDSTIFMGGFTGELALYNINKNTYQIIDRFPSSISNIFSKNNYCWITTLRNGVYYVPNINYKVLYTNSEPLVSMLPISNDSLYLLSSNSDIDLICAKNSIKLAGNQIQKNLMYWQRFDQSQKNYIPFVGCFDYIIHRSTKKKIKFKNNLSNTQTEFVVPVNDFIYRGYYGSIEKFDNNGALLIPKIQLPGRLTCMFGYQGILYVGSQGGLHKLENDKCVSLGSNSFFKNRIAALDRIGDNTLIIATQSNGIGLYDLKTKKLSVLDKKYGLNKLTIQHIFVDELGKIWIATQENIHVLQLAAKHKPVLLDVIDLNLGDLSIKEVRVVDGQIYILAGNCVIKIDEKRIKFNVKTYPVIINELLLNGEKIAIEQLSSYDLSPDKNNLQVKFQLLSFTQRQKIEYRYKLNNESWVYTTNNELQLVSLPSGNYLLSLQGRLKNGPWNSSTTLHFNIEKPFYKTLLFIFSLLITFVILAYILLSWYFKRKFRKRIKEFELRREIESARLIASKSQMNPHFIFNALNSIQNFIIKSEKIQAYQYLTEFSTLIRTYLEYSNKDYIKLDKELELIESYIKIEQLRVPFDFSLIVDDNINPSSEYIFNLLLQPCLENAIWHGLNHKTGNKKVTVFIRKNKNNFEVEITDNGIGRFKSSIINSNRVRKPSSVATQNMQNRIESLRLLYKNDIRIKILDNLDANLEPSGTTVLINFEVINEIYQGSNNR